MSAFTPVAIRKLNELINRDDFECIEDVFVSKVTIKFKENRCEIDKFGKVEWVG